MASGISINYNNTNRREYYLLRFLSWVTPFHASVFRRRRVAWGLNTADLCRFPTETLGHSLGLFLRRHNLEPVAKAERHDCFHVLLGFGASLKEETSMQWFLIGNGKLSLFTYGTAVLAILMLPEYFGSYYRAFISGRNAPSIHNWNFYKLLHCDARHLRGLIFSSTY
jgi:ubiquinone biosynthesis protein Coq4